MEPAGIGNRRDAMSLLDWCQHAIVVRASPSDNPSQANARIGHINQTLLREWPLGERRQSVEFSNHVRHNVRGRWRHFVPSASDFVPDGRLSAAHLANGQLRSVVLLG